MTPCFNGNVLSVTIGTLKLLSVSRQKICVRTHRSQAAKGPDVIDMSRRMMVLLGYCLDKHVYSGLIFLSSKMLSRVALFKQTTISSSRTTAFVSHHTTITNSLWRSRPPGYVDASLSRACCFASCGRGNEIPSSFPIPQVQRASPF